MLCSLITGNFLLGITCTLVYIDIKHIQQDTVPLWVEYLKKVLNMFETYGSFVFYNDWYVRNRQVFWDTMAYSYMDSTVTANCFLKHKAVNAKTTLKNIRQKMLK